LGFLQKNKQFAREKEHKEEAGMELMESLRTVTPGKMLLNMLNKDLFRAETASMASASKT